MVETPARMEEVLLEERAPKRQARNSRLDTDVILPYSIYMKHLEFRVFNETNGLMLDNRQGQIVIRLDGRLRDSNTGHGTFYNEPEVNPDWPTMLFTGLLDKNGKKIFEGDIVYKYHGGNNTQGLPPFVVRWNQQHCGFGISNGKNHCYEVIGNEYQNPELLDLTKQPS